MQLSSGNVSQRRKVSVLERDRRIQLPEAQNILRTAQRLIRQQGITAVRMRDIAQACGLTMTAPLYYFGTKGRMLAELLRLDHGRRLDRLRSGVESCATRDELVAALHGALGAFLDERTLRGTHELMAEITYLSLDDTDVAELRSQFRNEYRDVLACLLDDKQQEGIVRLSGRATDVAGVLISLAQGFAVEISADPWWRPAEAIAHARHVIDALLLEREPEPPA